MTVTQRSRSRKKSLEKRRASKKIQAAVRRHQNYLPPNVTGRSERLNRKSAKRRLSDHREYQRLVDTAAREYVPRDVSNVTVRGKDSAKKRRLSDHKAYERLAKKASQPRTYDQMKQAALASGMIGSGSSPASLRARLMAVGNRLSQIRR
jgi:hypothetical protein